MTGDIKLEPMFLNPVDAALHASIELEKLENGREYRRPRLQSILEALTDRSLRASGAIYGMTSLVSHSTLKHIGAISQQLDHVEEVFQRGQRCVERLSPEDAGALKRYCQSIHEHYQAARWIEERASHAR